MKRPCLLVIDDNATNLALLGYLLDRSGCEVCAAENGEQALKILAQRRDFDAVLCDIQLPVMDGYEFARQVRARPGLAQMPLVAITALAMAGDRGRILAAGFDGYVSKPIEPVEFIARAREWHAPRQVARDDAVAGPRNLPDASERTAAHQVAGH